MPCWTSSGPQGASDAGNSTGGVSYRQGGVGTGGGEEVDPGSSDTHLFLSLPV